MRDIKLTQSEGSIIRKPSMQSKESLRNDINTTVDTNIDIWALLENPNTYYVDGRKYTESLARQMDCLAGYGDIAACKSLTSE